MTEENYVYACKNCDFKSEDFDIVSQHVQNNNCKSKSEFEASTSNNEDSPDHNQSK
jgi:hypothetical protein